MRAGESLIGNPGAIHSEATKAHDVLENARRSIARELACKPREILFTSGLTESINLSILGFARALLQGRTLYTAQQSAIQGSTLERTHWIVSSIEHAAILECFGEIERLGGKVSYIEPDERGIFSVESVIQAIRKETVFISIGWANNEIGVVQPLRDITRALKEKHPHVVFHSDAGQAPLYLSPQVHTLGVDLMSFGSNKLYGPHGIGALYASRGVTIAPIILGGGQERGMRAGTENAALAAGFARAVEVIATERESESLRVTKLRDEFLRDIIQKIPTTIQNGGNARLLPHMLNISIPGIQSEYVTLALDAEGVALSTKSACNEGAEGRSHVVEAIARAQGHRSTEEDVISRASSTLRFSLGRTTRARDLQRVSQALFKICTRIKS